MTGVQTCTLPISGLPAGALEIPDVTQATDLENAIAAQSKRGGEWVAVGSGALARPVAATLPALNSPRSRALIPSPPPGPVLLLGGSAHAINRRQAARLGASQALPHHELRPEEPITAFVTAVATSLQTHGAAIVLAPAERTESATVLDRLTAVIDGLLKLQERLARERLVTILPRRGIVVSEINVKSQLRLLETRREVERLVAIVDFNKWQATGRSEEVLALNPLADKWRAFGWDAHEVDGHDMKALVELLSRVPNGSGKPIAIVAHTVKGKGVSFMEDDNNWHYRIPTADEVVRAKQELGVAA